MLKLIKTPIIIFSAVFFLLIITSMHGYAGYCLHDIEGSDGDVDGADLAFYLSEMVPSELSSISYAFGTSECQNLHLVWEGDYTIDSIEKFDAIVGYTKINGDLTISNLLLNTLEGLESLQEIYGSLKICNNDYILNLNGLENLLSVKGYISIESNQSLIDLTGLQRITKIQNNLMIKGNNSLRSLYGLDNVTNVGGTGPYSLYIIDNPSLENIDSLGNIVSIARRCYILNNDQLLNLDGLDNVEHLLAIYIKNNSNLLDIKAFKKTTELPWGLTIENNDSLLTLEGLDNITWIGSPGVSIQDNASLSSLVGLNKVRTIEGDFIIEGNPSLINLSGLDSLGSITSFYTAGEMRIKDNDSLKNFHGLNNFGAAGYKMTIQSNNSLETLDGLERFTKVGATFFITNNPILYDISILTNIETIGKKADVYYYEVFKVSDNSQLCTQQAEEIASGIQLYFGSEPRNTGVVISNNKDCP